MKSGAVFAVFVLLTLTGWRHVYGTCPRTGPQAERLVVQCFSPFSKVMDLSTGFSPIALQSFCQSSATRVVDCLEKLFGDCARENPTINRFIAKAIDLSSFRTSLKYFCNNSDVLINNEACIDKQIGLVTTCVNVEYGKYKSELESLKVKAYSYGRAWLADEIVKALCTYNDQLVACYATNLRNTCGDKVTDVFTALVVSQKPPGCSASNGQTGQGVSIGKNVQLMTIVGLLVIGLI